MSEPVDATGRHLDELQSPCSKCRAWGTPPPLTLAQIDELMTDYGIEAVAAYNLHRRGECCDAMFTLPPFGAT